MTVEQMDMFGGIPVKAEKKTVKKEKSTYQVNNVHLKEFTEIFFKIRTANYTHDYTQDYKLIGAVMRNAKKYDYDNVKRMLVYFQKYGLKKIDGKMIGFLTWAFMNPDIARQAYNTIDLQKNLQGGNLNELKLPSRDRYTKRFENIGRQDQECR